MCERQLREHMGEMGCGVLALTSQHLGGGSRWEDRRLRTAELHGTYLKKHKTNKQTKENKETKKNERNRWKAVDRSGEQILNLDLGPIHLFPEILCKNSCIIFM